MNTNRTKVEIKVSRTVQLYQYEPFEVSFTTTLENSEGVSPADIKKEERFLEAGVDAIVSEKISNLKKAE